MAPDGFPPVLPFDADDSFDVEAELRRAARSIIANRHRDIPAPLLDDMLANDDGLRAEYDALIDQMRRPVSPNVPRSGWLNGGIQVFEVTEAAPDDLDDDDVFTARDGTRMKVVRRYTFNYVPNRPRRTSIAPWAINYGQSRGSL